MKQATKLTNDMARPKRTGLKVGARTEFLVIGDVIPGHEDALRQVLKEHTANPRTQEAINEIGTLHEARFVLLDGGKRLMFASSFDGAWDKYIDDFAATAIGLNFDETLVTPRGTRASSPPRSKTGSWRARSKRATLLPPIRSRR